MEESLKKFILYTAPSGEVRVDVFSTTAAHPTLIQAKTKIGMNRKNYYL